MALTITDTEITSDLAGVRAEFRSHAAADGQGAWVVSGRPARLFTREQALSAVQLAEDQARLEADKLLAGLERELRDGRESEEDPDCE